MTENSTLGAPSCWLCHTSDHIILQFFEIGWPDLCNQNCLPL